MSGEETWSSLQRQFVELPGTSIEAVSVSGPSGEHLIGIRVGELGVFVVGANAAMGLGVDLIEEAFAAAGFPRDPKIDRLRELLVDRDRRK